MKSDYTYYVQPTSQAVYGAFILMVIVITAVTVFTIVRFHVRRRRQARIMRHGTLWHSSALGRSYQRRH